MTGIPLTQLRSWQTDDVIAYLRHLERVLSRNKLLDALGGRTLDRNPGNARAPLRIPLKAIPYDAKAEQEEVDRRERFRDVMRRDRNHEKPKKHDEFESSIVYADRHARHNETPKPLDDSLIDREIHRAVILGDPGSGKTSWLKAQAYRKARAAREALEACEAHPEDVNIPLFLRLADLATAMGQLSSVSADELKDRLVRLGIPAVECEKPWEELQPADRLARALLYAMKLAYPRGTDDDDCYAFSARLGLVLWNKLQPDPVSRGMPAFICLDGWDEIGSSARTGLCGPLLEYADRTGKVGETREAGSKILLTSRVAGYGGSPLFSKPSSLHRELRILGFDSADTTKFIGGYFDGNKLAADKLTAEIKTNHATSGFAANPLLATLLCSIYLDEKTGDAITLPLRRGEIYELVIEKLLGAWTNARGESTQGYAPWINEEEKRKSLIRFYESVAVQFFPAQRIDAARLQNFIDTYIPALEKLDPSLHSYLKSLRPAAPNARAHNVFSDLTARGWDLSRFDPKFLEDLQTALEPKEARNPIDVLCENHLLDAIGSGGTGGQEGANRSFVFLHLTFQEYLAARALARRGWKNIRTLIDRKSWDPRWREAVIMLAGLLYDPGPLLDLLTDKKTDDAWHSRTVLAALCLPEIPKHKRDDLDAKTAAIAGTMVAGALEEAQQQFDSFPHHHRPGLAAAAIAGARLQDRPLLEALAIRIGRKDKEALHMTGWIGTAAATPEILAALTPLLGDGDWNVRSAATSAVRDIGAAAATPEFLTALERMLRDGEAHVRHAVANAVSAIGAAAATPEFLAALERMLGDGDEDVRSAAADVVRRIEFAAATPEYLAELERMLGDGDQHVRYAAAESVRGLGAAAATPEFLAALARMMGDGDEGVRSTAANAVGGIGAAAATPEILAALPRMLGDRDGYRLRSTFTYAVKMIGAAAATPEIRAKLERMLGNVDEDVRHDAAYAIGRIGPAAATPEILAALLRLLEDEDGGVRFGAACAVGGIGAEAATPEIVAAVTRLLSDKVSHVRSAAANAVGGIGAEATTPEILAALERMLGDGDEDVRSAAADTVGWLGAAAPKSILAALPQLLRDEDTGVRYTAAETVGVIGMVPLLDRVPGDVMWLGATHWPHLRIFRRGKRFKAVPLSALTSEDDPED